MKYKKNNNKFKFPVDIKGDLDVPDFDISDNFSTEIIKNKIGMSNCEVCLEQFDHSKHEHERRSM